MTLVYVGLTLDVFHHGHAKILREAATHGEVIIGLLTDRALEGKRQVPLLTYAERERIALSLANVTRVVPQNEWDYSANLLRYKPDVMVHGDDWRSGPDSLYRQLALDALREIDAKLVEIPYTRGIDRNELTRNAGGRMSAAELRVTKLSRLFKAGRFIRTIEAHSPLSALIGQNASVEFDGGNIKTFDAFWSSSLTDSTLRGKPDIEAVSISSRLQTVSEILEVTTNPVIMDADTGGKKEHFAINVKSMESVGVSATIIEDKCGLKKNSLFGNSVEQLLESVTTFSDKIRAGAMARQSDQFLIIARLESLIVGAGVEDALARADAYISAGADAIMIHSNQEDPAEVFDFASRFRGRHKLVPLVSVPTRYNQVTEAELKDAGFNMVIYANQMLRSCVPAMQKVANDILRNGRSVEIDDQLMSVTDILELIPGTK